MTFGTKASPKSAPGLGFSLRSSRERLLDQLDRVAGAPLDDRQAVVFDVFQMAGDQRLELLVIGHARLELQQQAFAQIAGRHARRIEPLHDGQGFAGQGQLPAAERRARSGLPAALAGSRWRRDCR